MVELKLRDSQRGNTYLLRPTLIIEEDTLTLDFLREENKSIAMMHQYDIKKNEDLINNYDSCFLELFKINFFYTNDNFLDDCVTSLEEVKELGYNSLHQWVATRYRDMELFDQVFKNQMRFDFEEYGAIRSINNFFNKMKIEPKRKTIVKWEPVGLETLPHQDYNKTEDGRKEWNDFLDYFHGRSKINPFF